MVGPYTWLELLVVALPEAAAIVRRNTASSAVKALARPTRIGQITGVSKGVGISQTPFPTALTQQDVLITVDAADVHIVYAARNQESELVPLARPCVHPRGGEAPAMGDRVHLAC